MERKSKLSKLFSKTVFSIKRQISLAFSKHTANCWIYHLAYDHKYQGCESLKLTKNKLICIQRSKSFDNRETQLQFKRGLSKSRSLECFINKYEFDLQFKDINDIVYDSECDY